MARIQISQIQLQNRIDCCRISAHNLLPGVAKPVAVRIVLRPKSQIAKILPLPVIIQTVMVRIGDGNAINDKLGVGHDARGGNGDSWRKLNSAVPLIADLKTPLAEAALVEVLCAPIGPVTW